MKQLTSDLYVVIIKSASRSMSIAGDFVFTTVEEALKLQNEFTSEIFERAKAQSEYTPVFSVETLEDYISQYGSKQYDNGYQESSEQYYCNK